uniref:K Homology domain-containing protein n=1 Tax=Rhizophagus irregularis (strain DAOM 181602 / DAOM 197198 / MUCL 43194) TaxID=747089 RepID=U9UIF3_RHIID
MQRSEYIKSLNIPIPQQIEIGKLIGREGRNIKPIAERTGTHIYVDKITKPAQISISVNKKKEGPPFKNRIDEARNQLNDLMKDISAQNERKNNKIKKVKDDGFNITAQNYYFERKNNKITKVKDDGFKKLGHTKKLNDGFETVAYKKKSNKSSSNYNKNYEESETYEVNEDLEERFSRKQGEVPDYSDEMNWYGIIDGGREY